MKSWRVEELIFEYWEVYERFTTEEEANSCMVKCIFNIEGRWRVVEETK